RHVVFIISLMRVCALFFFFFQAEDGIRDFHVTGVQTCALPICSASFPENTCSTASVFSSAKTRHLIIPICSNCTRTRLPWCAAKIGRASCRERVECSVRGVTFKKKERKGKRQSRTYRARSNDSR